MINLDDPALYQKLDKAGMMAALRALPEQCRQAWQTARDFRIPANYRDVDKVLILGMGGSAIGGDLVRKLVEGEARIPVMVHRDYNLPHFVNEKTLVIASSYSGNTEETLTSFQSALKTGTKLAAITTGGKLAELAQENDIPFLKITYQGQPRSAIGFGVFPLLAILQKIGLLWNKSHDVDETIKLLEQLRSSLAEENPVQRNPAKQLANKLVGNIIVIYGGGFTAEAAHRWKTQINENAKTWAFYEVFPELNHNATVGYRYPEALAKKVKVIFLVSSLMNRRMKLRFDVTAELLEKAGVGYEYVQSVGESALAQTMSMVYLGDYVSCYLAMRNGVDPTPVDEIDYLKKRLAEG